MLTAESKPSLIKRECESLVLPGIPGVVFDYNGAVDQDSIIVLLGNIEFDSETDAPIRVSAALIHFIMMCERAVRSPIDQFALSITSDLLRERVQKHPKMSKYPFGNTKRRPCRSPMHPIGVQPRNLELDSGHDGCSARCTRCAAVERMVTLASWSTKLSLQAHCSSDLASAVTRFMNIKDLRRRLVVMFLTKSTTHTHWAPRIYSIPSIYACVDTVELAVGRRPSFARAFAPEGGALRRVLNSGPASRLKYAEAYRLILKTGWAPWPAVGSRFIDHPNLVKERFPTASGEVGCALVDNAYFDFVRITLTENIRIVASGPNRDFQSREGWLGPAQSMSLQEFVAQFKKHNPEVVYGNVTLSTAGTELYPGGAVGNAWFSQLWTIGGENIHCLDRGPEHVGGDARPETFTIVNDELGRNLWEPTPDVVDWDLIEHIKKGRPKTGVRFGKSGPKSKKMRL